MGGQADRAGVRIARVCAALGACVALANCASSDRLVTKVDPRYGVASSPRVVEFGEPVPKGGGTYRIGRPYMVAGRTYVPEENRSYRAEGLASWYGDDFHGRLTANGEIFDMTAVSAAHPTLPMPSYVRVTNLANDKSMIVRVNDRGPYRGDRIIDLSVRAAKLLGFQEHGVGRVRVEYVGPASLDGSDDRLLVATLRHGQPAPAPSAVMLASAKPFVPELRQAGWQGSVPVPEGRPYSLGYGNPAAAPQESGPERTAAARMPPPQTAFARATPVSAYAPVRYDGGFANGRGLY
jgi:peptidoglycan lytic transglycosylase